jgi:predicted enzyme related to lactoylglutathione lyase
MNEASALGQIVWHELSTNEPETAGDFYSKVVSWRAQPSKGHPYTFLTAGKSRLAGIKSRDAQTPGWPSQWIPYISTPDIDETIRSSQKMGGRVLMPPKNVLHVGRLAVLSDPQHCTFGLCTPDRNAFYSLSNSRAFSWHELATTDMESAAHYYAELFGWFKGPAHDMGQAGTYQVISRNDQQIAGLYKPPSDSGSRGWLSYILIADARKASEVAKSNGGRVVQGPMEVPGGSIIAQIVDPQGVTFAVHQPHESSKTQPRDIRVEPATGDLKTNSDLLSNPVRGSPDSSPRSFGSGFKFTREAADDELCLNVEDYANALAQLFASADEGEFCLAVFGPWGRGKTFLMRQVDRALRSMDRGYRTITFSAWKYPSAPEVWVHLYEEFAKEALQGPWYRVLPNVFRAGVSKHGSGPLLWAYALLTFGLFPLGTVVGAANEVLAALYPLVGVIGFVLLITLIKGVIRTKARLSHRYLAPSRHTEKLGLQATIGSDFRNLLMGWIPVNPLGGAFTYLYSFISAGLIAAVLLRLAQGKEIERLAAKCCGLNIVGSMGQAIEIAFVALIAAILVAVLYWLRHGGASPRKILLVVDDLDRCKPEHLLSVMESIKLLIEDPDISSRIQVAMLLEEDVLKHAIFEKYGHLADEDRASVLRTQYKPDLLIWENEEKLFTAHLRLPVLAKSELHDLIEAFSGRRREIEGRRMAAESPIGAASGENVGNDMTGSMRRGLPDGARGPAHEVATQSHAVGSTRVLEKDEVDGILAALDAFPQTRASMGPRAIRAFIWFFSRFRGS